MTKNEKVQHLVSRVQQRGIAVVPPDRLQDGVRNVLVFAQQREYYKEDQIVELIEFFLVGYDRLATDKRRELAMKTLMETFAEPEARLQMIQCL